MTKPKVVVPKLILTVIPHKKRGRESYSSFYLCDFVDMFKADAAEDFGPRFGSTFQLALLLLDACRRQQQPRGIRRPQFEVERTVGADGDASRNRCALQPATLVRVIGWVRVGAGRCHTAVMCAVRALNSYPSNRFSTNKQVMVSSRRPCRSPST